MKLRGIAGYLSIAALFAIVLVWGFVPKYESWYGLSLVGLSVVSFVLWVVLSLDVIALWLKKRSTQFYIALIITAIGSLSFVAVANWAAVTYNKKWDLTANQLHSLSQGSKNIAEKLKEEITIRVWTRNLQAMSQNLDMTRFLENYRIAGKGKIKVEIKNPLEDVIDVKTDNVKRGDMIIIKAQSGRTSRIETFSDSKGEEQITNAIMQAVKGSKKTVCFITGHGEFSINGTDAEGMSQVRDRLNDSSYEAKEISIANAAKVPDDCEALVISGPKGDASESELKSLVSYLGEGGKMLAMFGPGTGPGWRKLLSEYGVDIESNLLVEPRNQPPVAIATRNFAQDVDITRNANAMILFIEASSLKLPIASTYNGATVKTFISTESSAIAKTGLIKTMADLAPRSSDQRGPLPVAALISKTIQEASPSAPPLPTKPDVKKKDDKAPSKSGWLPQLIKQAHAQDDGHDHHDHGDESETSVTPTTQDGAKDLKKEMNLIVFANSSFAANGVVRQGGNLDLFLNSISFLLKDQELIGIRPRDIKSATLEITDRSLRQVYATIFFLSAFFFFCAVLAIKRKFVGTK